MLVGSASHIPVLLERVVQLVGPPLSGADPSRPATYVDATLGLGGHAEAVLTAYPGVRVIGIDRDPHALAMAGARLAEFGDRFVPVHCVYDEIADAVRGAGHHEVEAIFFDLGVSSMQLDVRERGFAYAEDAPLDMRMDDSVGVTAADVLNTYSAAELTRILRDYGEEKFARQIARAVLSARESEPFTRSGRLVELLYRTIPAPARRTGGHPAKRTFQALRIEVNDELAVLRRAIPAAIELLAPGGRVVVESYHSLEDRIVKQAFTARTRLDVPPDLPFVPAGMEPDYRLLIRGSEQADPAERETNPRAASVRLRAIERIAHPLPHPPGAQV